jgi:pyridoxine 4-dehydrogenase
MENLRRCLDNCHAALRGKKKVDLFECGRVDQKIPVHFADPRQRVSY